ncbi:Cmx/CmrA family chloramphenicol efflux MFS transporter [Microbacterium sp. 13-71-7]|uniref:Cmx/CmrA family chloramphenicol efflux MFS transporter n=1 Tax=Microbacterium sp. 13-71-7 TaxID=1970399 RepID=UPI000BDC9AEF|nr:Cmx/CmrA family chloramphenicol efflux MFS transporter [Microbacterium sp. 13-71-7]OZB81323.1 MAG: chloramphenicol efflux pump [Microbacterium sp. 13-71-7]
MPFALYLLALAVFVMGTSEFMLAGLLPAIATELDVSVGTAGLLNSAFAVGMVVGAPVMAAFARRWPPRLTLIICLLVFAGSHVIGALTPVFPLLVVARVLSALGNAGFLAVALSTATTLVPADQKGRALSILLAGTTIATVAGVPAGALLGTVLGWRATFWSIVILCIPAVFGVIRGIAGKPATPGAAPQLRAELARLANPRLVLAMTLGALINGGTFAAFTFFAPVVTETAGLAEGWVSVALVMFGIGSFFGVTIAGRLSDRRPGLVLAVGGSLLLTGWIVLAAVASHPVMLFVLLLIQGLLSFGVGSTVITRVLYASSGAPTMGGSYATAALNAGAAAGPVLGAFGLTTGLGLSAPMWTAAALTAAALVIMCLTGRMFMTPTAETTG